MEIQLIAFGVSAALAGISVILSKMKVASLRAEGIYPMKGKEREEDVLRLLKLGEKILAIRCYRTLHKTGLKAAKDAVEVLARKF